MTLQQLLSIPGNEQFKDNPDIIKPGQEVRLKPLEANDKDKQQAITYRY